ncbi:MAG: 6-phosphogluconolactonase [Micrococcales bacterium]
MVKSVRILQDNHQVAEVAAIDFVAYLTECLDSKPLVHVSITGGSVGILTLAKIAELPGVAELDWSRVHIWWGDERFVPLDSTDRNSLQAHNALLVKLPNANLHQFPAYNIHDGEIDEQLDQAAVCFEAEVSSWSNAENGNLIFDLTLLGMGPDGHVASLFPGHAEPHTGVVVVAEHASPKPPPHRLSFSYEAINRSVEIWFLVAGADKAQAVEVAFSGNPQLLPVGRVSGLQKTRWYLDQAAAQLLSK